jgi:integrase
MFKPKFKNKKGKYQKVKKFWVEVVDKRERSFRKVLRFAASEGRKLSWVIGDKIQSLINHAALGEPNPDLIEWFANNAPKKLQERLSDIGLLPQSHKVSDKPLLDYLPEFQQAIFQESKKSRLKKTTTADGYSRVTTSRVRKLIKGCGFAAWSDVTVVKVNEYIESRAGGMSQQTAHFYTHAFRRFSGWMFGQGYVGKALKIDIVPASRNYGRAFELDEFERLLKAAKAGPERYDLSGYQRYILYLLACETGLRRNEIRSLTVASIDLKNSCVFVKGGLDGATKNKDDAVQYFTPETGQILREYIRGKMPNVQLFKIHNKSASMIQADCEDADIEIKNHKGKLTFHSLRHTCGSYLAACGVQPKECMEIMRHKNINLTMSRYTHLLSGQKRKAINQLPRFGGKDIRIEQTA